jgi:hypothetical protein
MLTIPQHLQGLAVVVAEQRWTIDQLQQQVMALRQAQADAESGAAELVAERRATARLRADLEEAIRSWPRGAPLPPLHSLTHDDIERLRA